METVPNAVINEQIVWDAQVALVPFHPETPEQVEDMLLFWRRRSEMTAADLAEVCERMFPKPPTGPRVDVAHLRELARRVAAAGFAIDPDGDPSYLVERINTLLADGVTPTPPKSEWEQFPACPSWCTGRHLDDGQYRDCSSEEAFVPQYRNGVVCVDVETTFNRATGVGTPVLVRLEDYSFTPQYARHLAQLLVRAADLVDG